MDSSSARIPIPVEPVVILRRWKGKVVWPKVAGQDGTKGVVVFTARAKAEAFARANGLGRGWSVARLPLDGVLATLRWNIAHQIPLLVIDPEAASERAVQAADFIAAVEAVRRG